MTIILGIESTCDETAIAILKETNSNIEILSHIIISQQKLHEDYGGVVPELAARSHLNNIEYLIECGFQEANISPQDLTAIAASFSPGLIGGLIVGNLFAKTMCSILKKPFIAINHLEAHLLMPLINNQQIQYPFLAILISGGNTQIVLVKDFHNYVILGKTIDDSLGETFDKVALSLGFTYPGGPLIEKHALLGDQYAFKLPMPLCSVQYKNDTNFSFSGLKTHIKLLIDKNPNINKADVCASFQYTISRILINRIENAITNNNLSNIKNIVISGGVAANKYLQKSLSEHFIGHNISFPALELCTDNGVMIAYNGLLKYKKGFFETLDSPILAKSHL